MKKIYAKPESTLIQFDLEDIITVSAPSLFSNDNEGGWNDDWNTALDAQ